MELRSSNTTKYDAEDRSKSDVKANAMSSNGSGSGTTSGARNRKSGLATSSSGRRASPSRHQMAAKSSSCSNNEHCSKNNTPLSQHDHAALHDGTNGQVMGDPGNSLPASSASSANSRQRDVLLYDLFSV